MRSLTYLYDPFCGWCYAATPGIARVRAAGIALTMRPTGLFSEPGRVMTADFADYAWKNDQRIAAMTGQTFTEAYHRQVLQQPGMAFDSTNAILALTAVAMTDPNREAEALKALQEGRYMAGRDIADVATIGELLTAAGFAAAAAAFRNPSAQLRSANAARLAEGQALLRAVGGKGVPTLIVTDGTRRRLLDTGVLYGPAEDLLAVFQAAPAAA